MRIDRRTALLGTACAAALAACGGGDAPPQTKSGFDEADWARWLGEWDRNAKLTVGRSVARFGILGWNAEHVLRPFVNTKAHERGGEIPEELVAPLAPEAKGIDVADAERLLSQASERLDQLEQLIPLDSIGVYEWWVIRNGGLSSPPATQADIDAANARLGLALPATYAALMKVSNGWLMANGQLTPIDEVGLFAENDRDSHRFWKETLPDDVSDGTYNLYGEQQRRHRVRGRYLPQLVLLSSPVLNHEEHLLLNPAVSFEGGEWESWILSVNAQGAWRYKSFPGMMQELRARNEQTLGHIQKALAKP